MDKLINEIMFKLLATSNHPDREWLEKHLTEELNGIVDVYGSYREHVVLDEIMSHTESDRMSFSEWMKVKR
tara:strand:+ start:177 stop:389 length:213 start_codon:yes stop_codon:yes gene_type:complete